MLAAFASGRTVATGWAKSRLAFAPPGLVSGWRTSPALRLLSSAQKKAHLGGDSVPPTSSKSSSAAGAARAKPKRAPPGKQAKGGAVASASPKANSARSAPAKTVVPKGAPSHERALSQLNNLANNNQGFELEWGRIVSGRQRGSVQITGTLRYNARAVANELVGSIERSGKGQSATEAKRRAAAALLEAVQEQRAEWFSAAEAAQVVTTRVAASRGLKPTSRADIQQFVSQHDLLRSSFRYEPALGMVFAEASVAFPAHVGKLPRGVSLPPKTSKKNPLPRVVSGSALAVSRPVAEGLALKALNAELQALGMGPGKERIPGLTTMGMVAGEFDKAMHLLELVSVRGPIIDDLGPMAAVASAAGGPKRTAKGRGKKGKGGGHSFGVAVKPFLDHRIVSRGALDADDSGATFIGTAPNKKQAKHEAVVALARGLPQRLIDAGDPESAARVMHLKSLVDDALDNDLNLATLEVPRLPMNLLNEIQYVLEENGMAATDSLATRLDQERQHELDYAARELSRRHSITENSGSSSSSNSSGNEQRFNRRGQAPPMGAEETNAWLLKDLDEQPSRTGPAMVQVRAALPINELREELKEALGTQPVVVVSGGTGSGKTTQIPQYILDDAIHAENGVATRVIVTQPRRLAAISVSQRVAAERGEETGASVGYRVKMKSAPPRGWGANIEFCTTGILLRRLQQEPTLSDVSHVIIDEVHERDINTDFLLLLMKDVLKAREGTDFRLILMSATLDAKGFSQYFGGAPLVEVPSAPRFPVQEHYLEDLPGLLQSNEAIQHRSHSHTDASADASCLLILEQELSHVKTQIDNLRDEAYQETSQLVVAGDEVGSEGRAKIRLDQLLALEQKLQSDLESAQRRAPRSYNSRSKSGKPDEALYKIVADVARHIVSKEMPAVVPPADLDDDDATAVLAPVVPEAPGSVLCFLPGWDEIKEIVSLLQSGPLAEKMTVLPLHSTLTAEEQQRIFEPAPLGTMKVIVSTNIAESSVTIPDAIAIVDSGKVKELHYDPSRRMSELGTHYASTASATQRRGRAGRVAPGECYRVYSKAFFEGGGMLDRPVPEIQRMELQHTCLQTKALLPERLVHDVLSRAMDPPATANVEVALRRLEDLGAILTSNGASSERGDGAKHQEIVVANDGENEDTNQPHNEEEEELEVMTTLGRRLSMLPVEPAIGKMLLTGALFKCLDPAVTVAACAGSRSPFVSSPMLREQSQRAQKRFGPDSDLEAAATAFHEWQRVKDEKGFRAASDWAWDNSLVLAALTGIETTRMQLMKALGVDTRRFAPGSRGAQAQEETMGWGVPGSLNQRADDVYLQRALFAMSLPSNLARHRVCSSTGYRTSLEPSVGVHPGSVNCEVARGRRVVDPYTGKPTPGPDWLVYKEMVASSSAAEPFLRGTASVNPAALLLFCGTRLQARVDDSNSDDGSPQADNTPWYEKSNQAWSGDKYDLDGVSMDSGRQSQGGGRLPMGILDDWILCVAQDKRGELLETDLEAMSLLRAELHGVTLPQHLRLEQNNRRKNSGRSDQRQGNQGNGEKWVKGVGRQAISQSGDSDSAELRVARSEAVVDACVQALHAGHRQSTYQRQPPYGQQQQRSSSRRGSDQGYGVDRSFNRRENLFNEDDFFNNGPVDETSAPFKSTFFNDLLRTK